MRVNLFSYVVHNLELLFFFLLGIYTLSCRAMNDYDSNAYHTYGYVPVSCLI
jgi:hypothetical protein